MRWLLALALLAPVAAASPTLVGVVPDLPGALPGDEGFAVGCPQACDLSGWAVTDGEGRWSFPNGTQFAAGATVWVAGDAATWATFDGPSALALSAGRMTGEFRLANDGDSLQLLDPSGRAVDAYAWGDKQVAGIDRPIARTSPGLVHTRDRAAGSWVDTDRAADWVTPREHRIGETRLDQPIFQVERITLYASPDSSFAILIDLIGATTERLHLHVYELRSAALVDALVAAKQAHPNLDLQVLVDANPVGQTASERHATADALRRVEAAGGKAWLVGNGRYDDWHQKVLVADDAVAVQSENWVDSGVPQDPSTGNRGWGAILHDRASAEWFAAWMGADRAAWDVAPFDLATFDPLFSGWDRPAAPHTGSYGPTVPATTLVGPFKVTPLIAPDHTADPRRDAVVDLLARATVQVEAQQLDFSITARNTLGWSSPDPLLAGLQAASERGVAVRAQAAAPFAADDTGNAEALEELARFGVATATLERPGLPTLHNKGLLVDDAVLLGSMNGNHHSRSENREVDLLIEGPGAAAYFRALFDGDWRGDESPRDVGAIGRDLRGIPAPLPILFVALAVVLWVRKC
ncbi:MAG: phospholipase D-like domain-containing protein [Candidatus Thermoplasmatota archaeon]